MCHLSNPTVLRIAQLRRERGEKKPEKELCSITRVQRNGQLPAQSAFLKGMGRDTIRFFVPGKYIGILFSLIFRILAQLLPVALF